MAISSRAFLILVDLVLLTPTIGTTVQVGRITATRETDGGLARKLTLLYSTAHFTNSVNKPDGHSAVVSIQRGRETPSLGNISQNNHHGGQDSYRCRLHSDRTRVG